MEDIRDRADIDRLLRAFYAQVYADPLLGPIFTDVAQMDLEAHLPVIGDFWEKVLFNTASYAGGAMGAHRRLHQLHPLVSEHFTRWLGLWAATVDAHHAGEVSEAAKRHADRIAVAIQRNLAAMDGVPAQRGELPSSTTMSATPSALRIV